VRTLLAALPAGFDSDEYRNAMQTLEDQFKAREEQLFGEVESEARAAGIILLRTPAGFTLAPMKDGALHRANVQVHAVEHADQAMELLADQPAGSADEQGRFPAGTINGALRQSYAHPQQDGPVGNGQAEK
jgi:hypothetical protein